MKKLIIGFLTLIFLFNTSVFAQEIEESESVNDNVEEKVVDSKTITKSFELNLINAGQSPLTKKVTYILEITPLIDSPKTQIVWNIPSTLKVYPQHKEFLSMQEGVTYSVKATIKPLKDGHHNLSVSTISWQHDTNYTNSVATDIYFDTSLVTQPVTKEYKIKQIVLAIFVVLVFAGLIIGIIFLVKKYAKKAKEWLTPDF
ncbi:hypothetical protein KBG23_01185 [Candidatus Dojkabacteria bacterium]|jgi:hypothetical protein|nr:hypothetical protein [Candidatus Dojkabacteria bacterium]